MEKKRFEKPVAVPIKKRFAFTVFWKLCFKTPKCIEFISMRLKDGSYPGGAYDRMLVYNYTQCIDLFHISRIYDISKIQLVVYYQCCCQIQLVVYYQCCVQIG